MAFVKSVESVKSVFTFVPNRRDPDEWGLCPPEAPVRKSWRGVSDTSRQVVGWARAGDILQYVADPPAPELTARFSRRTNGSAAKATNIPQVKLGCDPTISRKDDRRFAAQFSIILDRCENPALSASSRGLAPRYYYLTIIMKPPPRHSQQPMSGSFLETRGRP